MVESDKKTKTTAKTVNIGTTGGGGGTTGTGGVGNDDVRNNKSNNTKTTNLNNNAGGGNNNDEDQPIMTAEDLKNKGNDCVRKGNYAEAILLYTQAIKMQSNDPILYSNRSLAFLKMKHYYYANADAEKTIQLHPEWAKGHFRRAEVLTAAFQYDLALLSYGRALHCLPDDLSILNTAKKVAALSNLDTMYEKRIPWLGAGIGIIIGAIIVISDQLFTKKPTITHPSLMVLLVMVVSGIFYGLAKTYRYYQKLQYRGLLEPPVNLLDGFINPRQSVPSPPPPYGQGQKGNGGAGDGTEFPTHNSRLRYTKAQARQRFRKGK